MNKPLIFITVTVAVVVGMVVGVWYFVVRPTGVPISGRGGVIQVSAPKPNAVVASPLTITGKARGTWYFEASFPVKIYDGYGRLLGSVPAQALSDWMTEDFVPFEAKLSFAVPSTDSGTLVLEKDNPSGLPENADELRIPVKFDLAAFPKRTVQLFYYNPANDQDASGNVMCSRNGLAAVQRQIPSTITPIQDTLRLLLKGELTEAERSSGVISEYPLAGVELTAAVLNNGTLTLTFNDPNNKTGGGSCRVGILWFQIEATARQFPNVTSVRFMPEELFQP